MAGILSLYLLKMLNFVIPKVSLLASDLNEMTNAINKSTSVPHECA
jgi:hypothetical protein